MKLSDIYVGDIIICNSFARRRRHGRNQIIDTYKYLVISREFYELTTQFAMLMTVAPIDESNKLGESMCITVYSLKDYDIPRKSEIPVLNDTDSLRTYLSDSIPIDLALFIGTPIYTMKKSNTHLSKAKTTRRYGSYHCKDYCTKSEIKSVIGWKLIDTDENISYSIFYKNDNFVNLFSKD